MKKTINDIEVDVHNHTILSGHAYSTFIEMVKEGKRKGLKVMGITDHGPYEYVKEKIDQFKNMKVLPRTFEGMDILRGSELNIIKKNGETRLAFPEDKINCLDIRLAGVHNIGFEYENERMEEYFEVMETGYVDVLTHPFKNLYLFDTDKLTEKAKQCNVLLELNNSVLLYGKWYITTNQMYGLMESSKKYNWPLLISSDAHYVDSVRDYGEVFKLLNEVDFPDELIINFSKEKFLNIIKKNHDNSEKYDEEGYVFRDSISGETGFVTAVHQNKESEMNSHKKVPYSFYLSETGYIALYKFFTQFVDKKLKYNESYQGLENEAEAYYGSAAYTYDTIKEMIECLENSPIEHNIEVAVALRRLIEHNPDCDAVIIDGP